MRRALVLALLAAVLLGGCSLKKNDSGCAADPAGVGGSGTVVCTRPPPTQFNQLGQ